MSEGQVSAEGPGRRFGRMLGAVVLVCLAGVGVSMARVGWPTTVEVEHVDAVVVHASNGARLDAGLELVRSGVAPVLVVSDAGEDYGRDGGFLDSFCGREEPFEVVCRVPEPSSTIGEARAFGALARQRGWDRLAVVTSHGHLTRAQLAMSQCTDAEVLPVAVDSSPWVGTVVKEWLATGATATLWRACW